jgi:drug/metabolite transporter (DMT)-like permease
MKLLTWLGVAIAVCGTVLMSLSERLPGFSTDRVPGWFDQVHWYLLVGILVTLGGGLMAQFGRTVSRHARLHRPIKQTTALVARAG